MPSGIAYDIGAEDCGEFTPKTFFCHNGPPLFKVSNRGTQDVNYSKERKNQMRIRIRFSKWRTSPDQVE
jgi:hypothetical protein